MTRPLVCYRLRVSTTGSEYDIPRTEALRLLRGHMRKGGQGFREYKIAGKLVSWNLCPGLRMIAMVRRFPVHT